MANYAIIIAELAENLVHPHLNINITSHIMQAAGILKVLFAPVPEHLIKCKD